MFGNGYTIQLIRKYRGKTKLDSFCYLKSKHILFSRYTGDSRHVGTYEYVNDLSVREVATPLYKEVDQVFMI